MPTNFLAFLWPAGLVSGIMCDSRYWIDKRKRLGRQCRPRSVYYPCRIYTGGCDRAGEQSLSRRVHTSTLVSTLTNLFPYDWAGGSLRPLACNALHLTSSISRTWGSGRRNCSNDHYCHWFAYPIPNYAPRLQWSREHPHGAIRKEYDITTKFNSRFATPLNWSPVRREHAHRTSSIVPALRRLWLFLPHLQSHNGRSSAASGWIRKYYYYTLSISILHIRQSYWTLHPSEARNRVWPTQWIGRLTNT